LSSGRFQVKKETPASRLAYRAKSELRGQGGVSVQTLTLESLLAGHESVDLLKLDAEGAEYQALPVESRNSLLKGKPLPAHWKITLLPFSGNLLHIVDLARDGQSRQSTENVSSTA
jgi:hypothetical protein